MRDIVIIMLCAWSWLGLQAQCPNQAPEGYHVVQPKESLYRISQKYGVSIGQLCEWNQMGVNDNLPMCSELRVSPVVAGRALSKPSDTNPEVSFYGPGTPGVPQVPQTQHRELPSADARVARPKDSPQDGTAQPPQIQGLGIVPSQVSPPTHHKAMPAVPKPTKYSKQGRRHTVQQGQTIANIAYTYGYTEERFREFNALTQVEELPTGSVVLTTECSCPLINETYKDYTAIPERDYEGAWPTPDLPIRKTEAPYPKEEQAIPSPSKPNPKPSPPASVGEKLDADVDAEYMSSEERAMVAEINLLRGNPSGYVKYLEEHLRMKKEKGFPVNEPLYEELITELKNTRALSILKPSECIHEAARKHGLDLQKQGKNSHVGSDGSWPWDRVKYACTNFKEGNENIVAGPATVRESVIILLLDDGIASRGHRKTLLNPIWTHSGPYKVGRVGIMDHSWVQKFGKLDDDSLGK